MTEARRDPSSPVQPASRLGARSRLQDRIALIGLALAICVLIALLVPQRVGKFIYTFSGKSKADIMAIHAAADDYALANDGRDPETLEMLVIPDEDGHRYLQQRSVPIDPWGREYGYEPPTAGRTYPRIYTLGWDGEPGGEGENADIDNYWLLDD